MMPNERMVAATKGERPDKIPFLPTIFEHAAFLIGRMPSVVARNAAMMARAHVEAYRRYRPDAVTVGIDVYNVEAEALGCRVRFYDNSSIPGIVSHPLALDGSLNRIVFSPGLGRIRLVQDAALKVKRVVGHEVPVSIGICGPFSIMIELLGYERAVKAFYDDDERMHHLLKALLEFQKRYCDEIMAKGLSVNVFESWASPPLISPDVYNAYAFPYERALFMYLEQSGKVSRPLVIGGNTRCIVSAMLETGATLLISDYNTPLPLYVEKARAKGVLVRANIDPKSIHSGAWESVRERIREIHKQAETYPKIIAGTGVIPFNTPPENILRVKGMLQEDVEV